MNGKFENKEISIKELFQSLRHPHRSKALRSLLTLETKALKPAFFRSSDAEKEGIFIHQIFATQKEESLVPWCYALRKWPEDRLLFFIDILDLIPEQVQFQEPRALYQEEENESLHLIVGGTPGLYLPDSTPQLTRLYRDLGSVLPKSSSSQKSLNIGDLQETEIFYYSNNGIKKEESYSKEVAKEKKENRYKEEVTEERKENRYKELFLHTKKILSLAEEEFNRYSFETLKGNILRIKKIMHEPQFSVTVAGEFSRGKSTFLNRLFEKEFLPTGDLPTTMLPAFIRFGEEQSITYVKEDGTREHLRWVDKTWQRFYASDDVKDLKGRLLLEIPNPWLQKTGFQFIDTPGAGDLDQERFCQASEFIVSSNAALVVVSAHMPLSLTERSFIEEQIIFKNVPRVAVILSRLDELHEKERIKVVKNLEHRLSQWAPKVPIWLAHSREELGNSMESWDGIAGTEQIKASLFSWGLSEEHRWLRLQQVSVQLEDLLQDYVKALEERIFGLESLEKKEKDFLDDQYSQLSISSLVWSQLEEQLAQREEKLNDWLFGALKEVTEEIHEELRHTLQAQSEPGAWWNHQFSYLLRKRFSQKIKGFEKLIHKELTKDALWLEQEVRQQLGWASDRKYQLQKEDPTETIPNIEEVEELQEGRFKRRIGIAAATVASYILMGPLGVLVSAAGGLVNEAWNKKEEKSRKEALSQEMSRHILDFGEKVSQEIRDRIESAYDQLIRQMRAQAKSWRKIREQSLKNMPSVSESLEEKQKMERALKTANEYLKETSSLIASKSEEYYT